MDITQVTELWNMVPDQFKDISALIGILSMIAAFTPTPVDDGVLAILRKVLNLGGFNFGESKNAKVPGTRKKRKAAGPKH